METGFFSLRKSGRANASQKRKEAADIKGIVGKNTSHSGHDGMMRLAIREHFHSTASPDVFYSVPDVAEPKYETLGNFFGSKATGSVAPTGAALTDAVAHEADNGDIRQHKLYLDR